MTSMNFWKEIIYFAAKIKTKPVRTTSSMNFYLLSASANTGSDGAVFKAFLSQPRKRNPFSFLLGSAAAMLF
jgi:hypothetical protein